MGTTTFSMFHIAFISSASGKYLLIFSEYVFWCLNLAVLRHQWCRWSSPLSPSTLCREHYSVLVCQLWSFIIIIIPITHYIKFRTTYVGTKKEHYLERLWHSAPYSKRSVNDPALLIMDNHSSHCPLKVTLLQGKTILKGL